MSEQPTPYAGQQSVTRALMELLAERERKGIETYGRSLETFNGRSAPRDLLEELIDGAQYALQWQMERDVLLRQLEEARTDNASLLEWIEKDKTGMYAALTKIREAVAKRGWILDGRGPYEWDDERYRQETHWAFEEVCKIIFEAHRESDERVKAARADYPGWALLKERDEARQRIEDLENHLADVETARNLASGIADRAVVTRLRELLGQIDTESTPDWNCRETYAVRDAGEVFGYGAVMSAAAQLWREKDPVGALTVGPCVRQVENALRGET